ncbi:hypothetical protein LCGC14_0750310 [marine sediment metagenome]|uniref:Uncharacterized protein n=1 Tax=marine sediment metagenome TaxID=412755 RepID=A0A0F9TB95_9ZZZZ
MSAPLATGGMECPSSGAGLATEGLECLGAGAQRGRVNLRGSIQLISNFQGTLVERQRLQGKIKIG